MLRSKSLYSFYILGLLNGLLPCGLVYFFAVTAVSTGSPLWGALVMFIFGLNTIPALFGLYTIYRGYDFIENPEKYVLNCCEDVKDVNDSGLAPFKAVEHQNTLVFIQ